MRSLVPVQLRGRHEAGRHGCDPQMGLACGKRARKPHVGQLGVRIHLGVDETKREACCLPVYLPACLSAGGDGVNRHKAGHMMEKP